MPWSMRSRTTQPMTSASLKVATMATTGVDGTSAPGRAGSAFVPLQAGERAGCLPAGHPDDRPAQLQRLGRVADLQLVDADEVLPPPGVLGPHADGPDEVPVGGLEIAAAQRQEAEVVV